jgi:hypothetical protein
MRTDTIFNTTDDYRVQIRQIAQPEEEAKKIYSLLDIKIHKNTATQKFRLLCHQKNNFPYLAIL